MEKRDRSGVLQRIGSVALSVGRRLGVQRIVRDLRKRRARLLHPLHRRRAIRRLHAAPELRKVLFVCQGNIYRSPYAEQVFLKLISPERRAALEVSSAGFVGPGRACPAPAIALATGRGVDLSAHRSSRIRYDRIDAATLVVVVEPRQEQAVRHLTSKGTVLVLGDLDPEPVDSRTIQDPWSEAEGVLTHSYNRVERCIRVLASELEKRV